MKRIRLFLTDLHDVLRSALDDAKARRKARCCADHWAIGGPALNMQGEPMKRCTSCGIPRGTVRHSLFCTANKCVDPDADRDADPFGMDIDVRLVR